MGLLGLECFQITGTCGLGIVTFIISTMERQKWLEHKQRESAVSLSPQIISCATVTKHKKETPTCGDALSSTLRKQANLSWQIDQERSGAMLLPSSLSDKP